MRLRTRIMEFSFYPHNAAVRDIIAGKMRFKYFCTLLKSWLIFFSSSEKICSFELLFAVLIRI